VEEVAEGGVEDPRARLELLDDSACASDRSGEPVVGDADPEDDGVAGLAAGTGGSTSLPVLFLSFCTSSMKYGMFRPI
jgi:hypothetical protein